MATEFQRGRPQDRGGETIGVRFFFAIVSSKLQKNKLCSSCYLTPILFGLEEWRASWAIQITLHEPVNYHLYMVFFFHFLFFLCVRNFSFALLFHVKTGALSLSYIG